MYRVQVVGQNRLCYIGQTGRNLRERLRELRRNTLSEEMPFNDPHTAACRLWSYRHAENLEFEMSVAPVIISMPERMALECFLIWKYRLEAGNSPLCNFGRLHPHYSHSRNRSTGIRGGLLPEDQRSQIVSSMPPLPQHGNPMDSDWMTLSWTQLEAFNPKGLISAPEVPGVYKLIAGVDQLLYVGESANLKKRLATHLQRTWGDSEIRFAFCSLPQAEHASQRLEIENDLIAGYYSTTKRPPTFQFGVKVPSSPEH